MTGGEAWGRVRQGLSVWFRAPPRRHGEVLYSREVGFLELFYDLVYVVLIGRVAHHLATHVGWRGTGDFAVVFGLIWLACFNGTFWHDLHAREDGRSRLYIFGQMCLLALLAVYAGDATGKDGAAFAITYAVLFALLTWQWYVVHRIDDPHHRPTTTRYLLGMLLSVVAVLASAGAGETAREAIWAVLVVAWVAGGLVLVTTDRTAGFGKGVSASLVERVGLFTIIVLGEVVGGVSDAEERTATTIATRVIGLSVGLGLWWNYFDLLGRRVPDERGGRFAGWLYSHLPLTMAIAAGGAAMVSIVEHAADSRTPVGPAWLLTASVAVAPTSVTLAVSALPAGEYPTGMARHVAPTFGLAAAAIILIGAARPSPVVLVAAVATVLAMTWAWLFIVFLALEGVPGVGEEREPGSR